MLHCRRPSTALAAWMSPSLQPQKQIRLRSAPLLQWLSLVQRHQQHQTDCQLPRVGRPPHPQLRQILATRQLPRHDSRPSRRQPSGAAACHTQQVSPAAHSRSIPQLQWQQLQPLSHSCRRPLRACRSLQPCQAARRHSSPLLEILRQLPHSHSRATRRSRSQQQLHSQTALSNKSWCPLHCHR